MRSYDAVVIGSGPNGLAAGITLAQAGRSVVILEASSSVGGGARSEALTAPGFLHDVCSAVHPLAVASPFFQSLGLEKWGLEWIHSPQTLAHPLDDESPALLNASMDATAENLGEDGESYLKLMKPFVSHWQDLFAEILQPIFHFPRRPFLLARFGVHALLPPTLLVRRFRSTKARALFAGIAAHANSPLTSVGPSAIGLMLNLAAHAKGWPIPRGGSQKIAEALKACFESLGGEIRLNQPVRSLKDLPPSKLVFFDLTPKQIALILKPEINLPSFANYKYGSGVFKMDWALSGPIPWRSPECLQAATVHLGGRFEEIEASEAQPSSGGFPKKPYVLLAQPSLFDPTRAPAGFHTAWAYSHVPFGSLQSQVETIENQIERFAPGFRERILHRRSMNTRELEEKNNNLVGGDISAGSVNWWQLLFRPGFKLNPYRLPIPGFYICSAATPPGPAVHGMCGFNAARSALL